jgi:DNA-binding transcriptional LysR family regulator
MDVTLERTFLEIAASGSFLRASERLHVTQTAVSARVKALEALLGRRLFVRHKSGATLTPAGQQFVPRGRSSLLTVGCEASLWDPLMLNWLLWMRQHEPRLALRAEVGLPADLLARVANGTLDIAVLYAPQQRPGIRVDLLIEEKLVFVTTAPSGRVPTSDQYVHIDWGPEFAAQFALAYPGLSDAAVSASLGPLGLAYVLAAGGGGYFRQAVLREHLAAGRLHRVKGAPEFSYPAYAVHAANAGALGMGSALTALRETVGASAPSVPHVPSEPARRGKLKAT